MEGSDSPDTGGRLLRGWKEIAAYLGTSPRSAQRFAAELDLPVHRTGHVHGAVSAFTTELDAWTRRRACEDGNPGGEVTEGGRGLPVRELPTVPIARPTWAVAACAAVVAVGVVGWLAVAAVRRADERPRADNESSATPATARAFTLGMRLDDGREFELKVAPGSRATLGVAPHDLLQFEAELRGERLRVTIFDMAAGATGDAREHVAGVVDLVQSPRGARKTVELEFAAGSLAVAWLTPPS